MYSEQRDLPPVISLVRKQAKFVNFIHINVCLSSISEADPSLTNAFKNYICLLSIILYFCLLQGD